MISKPLAITALGWVWGCEARGVSNAKGHPKHTRHTALEF